VEHGAAFLAHDFAVYAMDRRGHGASDPYRAGHTLERDVEDALALLEANSTSQLMSSGMRPVRILPLEAAARSSSVNESSAVVNAGRWRGPPY